MQRHPARFLLPLLFGLLILLFAGRAIVAFYTEVLWFGELDYAAVFWRRLVSEATIRLITTVLGGGLVLVNLWLVTRRLGPVHVRRRYGNLEISEQVPRRQVIGGIVLAAFLTGLWLSDVKFGGDHAIAVLTMLRHAAWSISDPLFNRDLSFYVFTLPVYFQAVDFLLLIAFWSVLLSLLGYTLVGALRLKESRVQIDDRARMHVAVLLATVVALLGVRYWLSRYGVLFHGSGFGDGVGYTDVHARLPAHRILAVLALVVAATIAYGAARRNLVVPAAASALLVLGVLIGSYLIPSAVQKLIVEPDEYRKETRFIAWNMEYTRRAFALDSIERRTFAYRRSIPSEASSLARQPLWDPQPLTTAFNALESLFGYYRFAYVDFDRYRTANGLEQVGIGVREFHSAGLPESSRTWQTLHLNPQYVRGIGAVVALASAEDANKPLFWMHQLPVQRRPDAPPQITLTEPSIFIGETMGEYVVLDTEADTIQSVVRPRGIPLSSFLRVFAFAWRFSDKNLLFSGQLTDSSRILFRRRLDERLHALAPFLRWDADAQPVIHDGRVHWLVDGYAATPNFPIARPLRQPELRGEVRYLRPAVKAVVDAVTGAVDLYAVTETEPWLETYRLVFPELFHPLSEMPPELQAHVRYPAEFLQWQADILREYHIERPDAFYSGQDVWQLPRERGEQTAQPFHPLYTMLSVEPGKEPEFVLSAPFIARQRQNLTAMLLVRNDPPNYGRMLLLELPRDQQVSGPAQVEALMEQDPVISPQLSLWRQAGSTVDLGQVRIVPIDSTLLYVVPLFLAAGGSPIPELQRIIVSDGDRVAMAPTLQEAMAQLRGAPGVSPATATTPAAANEGTARWPARALQLLEAAETSLRNGDWAGYGARLKQLRELLQQISQQPETQR